ncbi:MAG: ParA family protein [Deltaproteobacteria bacterium]|nr:ParA family protein [Deltaproteobacteria bacterium]
MILAVANQKGGVGKTTTVVNMGAALAEQGAKVLLVDLDPQGGASLSLTGQDIGGEALAAAIVAACGIGELARETGIERLWLVPGSPSLAEAEALEGERGAIRRLQRALTKCEGAYDVVLLDTSPHLGFLTISSLVAASGVLVPFEAHPLSLKALTIITSTVDQVRMLHNPGLRVLGYLPTRAHPRRKVHEVAIAEMEETYPGLLAPPIRELVEIALAPMNGSSVLQSAPRSGGAQDYRDAARWLAAQLTRE